MRVRVLRRCGTSSNHVALATLVTFPPPAHPPVVAPFVPRIYFPAHPHPRARPPPLRRSARRRKIMLLPPTSLHPRTPSQRRNQRRVTRGNGRKEEGSDRHFQARFPQNGNKNDVQPLSRCPGHQQSNGIVNELHRYVSRVLSRFLVYALF